MTTRPLARAIPLIAALALGACGQDNTGDTPPPGGSSLAEATFLLFPNPQVLADGSLQTNSVAYAQAYYTAIDPMNTRDTLAKWKAANFFDTGGTQETVVFGDVRDLGYGRRMTARQTPTGIAVLVENYMVSTVVDYTFTNLNVEAAVHQVSRWLDNINAIEFSSFPNGGVPFAKFFQFNPATGARELMVNIDGRGQKAMPGPCIACHGGRADPLEAPSGLFPLPANLAAQKRGDTQARLMPLEVGTFAFPTTPGFTRADQEAKLKLINRMVLCTYPGGAACPTPIAGFPPAPDTGGWQGTAAVALVQGAYGGAGLPNAAYTEPPVPAGWAGQAALYQSVVAPTCRGCHIVRGTISQPDIDFTASAHFGASGPGLQGFADRIKAHVFERGNMPLAKIIFDDFWSTGKAETLATFLGPGFIARDGAGAVLRPGRPIANPGLSRTTNQQAVMLSAAGSLFSTTYNWRVVSGPGGVTPPINFTLTNPSSVQPTFSTTSGAANLSYVLELVTGNAAGQQSAAVQITLVVNSNNVAILTPSAIRFSSSATPGNNVATAIFGTCAGCHATGGTEPLSFTAADYGGNMQSFYTQVRGRINFTDIVASPLLRKPSNFHHNGGLQAGFSEPTAAAPGGTNYNNVLNWILNGAPM